jgi:hypothetical protein
MHLICKTAFLAAVVSTLACHDLLAPPTPPAGYTLANVSGRPLPTFVSPIPEGPTIVSATLQLGAAGGATLTEHRHEMAGGDVTYTSTYTYSISGNQIQLDYSPPCPPNALCASPPKGTISGSDLSLDMYGDNSGIVYNFRLLASD